MEELFEVDLINVTVILFQSLSPIRLSFVDGQRRVVYVSHLVRDMIPTASNTLPPNLPMPLGYAKKCKWSLASTGSLVGCVMLQTREVYSHLNPPPASMFASFRQISKDRQWSQEMVARTTLCDAIRFLALDHKPLELPEMLAGITGHVKSVIKHVTRGLFLFNHGLSGRLFSNKGQVASNTNHPDLDLSSAADEVYNQLHGARELKIFPVPTTVLKSSSSRNGFAISLVVGALFVDTRSRLMLLDCINREWRVPIVSSDQVGGFSIGELHGGTYISDVSIGSSPRKSSFFDSHQYRLFRVSRFSHFEASFSSRLSQSNFLCSDAVAQ